jgi:hypothetical protein
MVTRSTTTRTGLACCDCGALIEQGESRNGSPVNWWLVMMILSALLGTIALFMANDEPSSGTSPEVTPKETLLRFRTPHSD